jgi:lipid-A-disaccharide synthase
MKRLFIVAGESSGDLHGSALTRALLRREPGLAIKALGGPLMQRAGAELVADLTSHAVVGLIEGVRNVSRIYTTYRRVVKVLKTDRPDAVVLIDYPEFNLRLARQASKLGIPVVYYISPQVWAWRQWRVKTIEKYVDKMLVIFPFEEDFYRKYGVQAEFVGHPLVGMLKGVPDKQTARTDLGLPPDELVIGLLPGSRKKEIQAIFPTLLRAAEIINATLERPITFVCARAPALDERLVEKYLSGTDLNLRVVGDDTYRVMRSADLLLTASGTATVEAMILGTPMIVVYSVSLFTWVLFIRLIKVDHYAMANIIAGKEIVPEFVQWGASPERIAREAVSLIQDGRMPRMAAELARATAVLRMPRAADNPGSAGEGDVPSAVAARILDLLGARR